MSNIAEVFHRRIQCPVFHPRLCRALLAEPLEETNGTASEVIRVRCLSFAELGKILREYLLQGTLMKIVDIIGIPEGQAHLGMPVRIDAGAMPGTAGEDFVARRAHELSAELLHAR